MATVNIHEAKTHLSRLVDRAEKGEEIVIARAGKPIVRLERIAPLGRRVPGVDKGRVVIHPDFDDPLPEFDPDYAHPEDPLLESDE
jgi:prevent-host-death family protein